MELRVCKSSWGQTLQHEKRHYASLKEVRYQDDSLQIFDLVAFWSAFKYRRENGNDTRQEDRRLIDQSDAKVDCKVAE